METPVRLEIQFDNDDLDANERLKRAILRDAKDWPGVERADSRRDLVLRKQPDVTYVNSPIPAQQGDSQIRTRGSDDDDESIWIKLLPSSLKQILSIFGEYVKSSNTKSPIKLKIGDREVSFSSKQDMTPELLERYVDSLSKKNKVSESEKTSQ